MTNPSLQPLGSIQFGEVLIKILGNSDKSTVAQLHFQAGVKADTHHHMHEEYNYVVRGAFECLCDGETLHLQPGDLVRVPENTEHNLHCIGPEDGVIVTFWTPSREDLIAKLA